MVSELRDFIGVTTLVFLAGLLIGALFGWVAERSDFCIRSSLIRFGAGNKAGKENGNKHIVMLITASLVAFMSVQLSNEFDFIDYSGSLHANSSPNVFGIFL